MSAEYVHVPESDRESRLLAEIERLKASFKTVNDLLNNSRQENSGRRKLIGEMADALTNYYPNAPSVPGLIKRAREAVK
jgi:hypothetical protein